MDDDDDFDFDAIDRIERDALAARQRQNYQPAAPGPSYPAYQPPQNNGGYYNQPPQAPQGQYAYSYPAQAGQWHQPPGQHPQQQWQQPGQNYYANNNPGPSYYNPPPSNAAPPQPAYGYAQPNTRQGPPPPQPPQQAPYYPPTQQQQWQQPPQQQQQYNNPPQQTWNQPRNAWQPAPRPSVWQQPPHQPPAMPAPQPQAQPAVNNPAVGQTQQYPQHRTQQPSRRSSLQPSTGPNGRNNNTNSNSGLKSKQRDLHSIWGVRDPPNNAAQPPRNPWNGSTPSLASGRAAPPPPSLQQLPGAPQQQPDSRNNHETLPESRTLPQAPPRDQGNVDIIDLVDCETTTGALRVHPEAAKNWVYPAGVPEREYQISAITTALLQNTLVCLPTGLGKTLIAAVVMQNFTRWFPESKVVFVAPTKPLVSQQIEACRRFMGLAPDATAELTGRIKSEERKALWDDPARRVFFCTPQTFNNDVKLGVCPYDAVSCVVVDECHRATGQSDIVQTLNLMRNKHRLKFRVLGLSATPGSTGSQVAEVLKNLGTAAMYFRNEEDPDVAPYVHKKVTELVVVDAAVEDNSPKALLLGVLQRSLANLARSRCYFGTGDANRVTRFMLTEAQNAAKEAAARGNGVAPTAAAQELFRQVAILADLRDSLDSFGVIPTASLLHTKLSEEKCLKTLYAKESSFSHFVVKLDEAAAAGGGGPRLAKLVSILREHFEADGDPGNVIVFSSLRDGVQTIVEALRRHNPLIRPKAFLGQGGTGTGGGSSSRAKSTGMNQKEQKEAIKGFVSSEYNVLVATCIGEEGLDIPAVDLIICYDATASPTRVVQRTGRTGRHRDGRVVYILSSGREEEHYHRIQEATAQLHSQLRQPDRYFDFVPGPRMLPRQYNPVRLDVESGYKAEAEQDRAEGGSRGRGRGRGGGSAGRGRGRGRGAAAEGPAAGRKPGLLAMLEAGAAKAAMEGPRYLHAPPSPSPSQPFGATPLETAAGPHKLLFASSSAFIKAGAQGKRLTVGPPPPLEELLGSDAGVRAAGESSKMAAQGDQNEAAMGVHTPEKARERLIPELLDDGSIKLPFGKSLLPLNIIEDSVAITAAAVEIEHHPWAYLAAAIARPAQVAKNEEQVNKQNAAKKRKAAAGRGRNKKKAVVAPTAAAAPQLTPPTAMLAVAAEVLEDEPMAEKVDVEDAVQPAVRAVVEEPRLPAVPPADLAEASDVEVIDLISSDDEDQPAEAVQKNDSVEETEDDGFEMVETLSQRPLAERLRIRQLEAQAIATAAGFAVPALLPHRHDRTEEDVPLAKRMKMLRSSLPSNSPLGAPPSATPINAAVPTGAGPPPSHTASKLLRSAQQNLLAAATATAAGSVPLGGTSNPRSSHQNQSVPNSTSAGGIYEDDWAAQGYDSGGFYGHEYDEVWEGWKEEEGQAAAAGATASSAGPSMPPPSEPKISAPDSDYNPQSMVAPAPLARRRNIITSQSPGSTQAQPCPQLAASPSPLMSNSQPRTDGGLFSSGSMPPVPPAEIAAAGNRLTRLRKAGNVRPNADDDDTRPAAPAPSRSPTRKKKAHRTHQPPPKPAGHRGLGGATRFLDTEAQLSGDDDEIYDEEEDGLDEYEADFIDDASQPQTASGPSQNGSLATPGGPASLAALHQRRLHEDRYSPSPGEILRRLQRGRFNMQGREGVTPLGGGGGHHRGGPGQYSNGGAYPGSVNDDYDREDSFIDDGDDAPEGFDTPAGRESHDDVCGRCRGDDGELLLCDACPAAFHLKCVGLKAVPLGDWFCPVCADSGTPAGGGGRREIQPEKAQQKVPVLPPPAAVQRPQEKKEPPPALKVEKKPILLELVPYDLTLVLNRLEFIKQRVLLQNEASQNATAKVSGSTSASTESAVKLQITGDSIAVEGTSSVTSEGDGQTIGFSKTDGYVREGDGPYVANIGVGLVAAEGKNSSVDAKTWGSSEQGPDGPHANAGHQVNADGAFTGSTGDQAVAQLENRP